MGPDMRGVIDDNIWSKPTYGAYEIHIRQISNADFESFGFEMLRLWLVIYSDYP